MGYFWTCPQIRALREIAGSGQCAGWEDVSHQLYDATGRMASPEACFEAAKRHRITFRPKFGAINRRNATRPRWTPEMVRLADDLSHLSASRCADEMNRELGRSDITRNMVIGWRWRNGYSAA